MSELRLKTDSATIRAAISMRVGLLDVLLTKDPATLIAGTPVNDTLTEVLALRRLLAAKPGDAVMVVPSDHGQQSDSLADWDYAQIASAFEKTAPGIKVVSIDLCEHAHLLVLRLRFPDGQTAPLPMRTHRNRTWTFALAVDAASVAGRVLNASNARFPEKGGDGEFPIWTAEMGFGR